MYQARGWTQDAPGPGALVLALLILQGLRTGRYFSHSDHELGRLGLAALYSGTAHRSGQAEQGDTGRTGANEEAKASTSASGPFMSLGFLSERQKSVLHCIRTSGRE